MSGAVAVLDIGKTNVKLALFAPDGTILWERSTPNRVRPGPPYPHADVEAIWAFLIDALREANGAHRVEAIVTTTHGCAGALIDEKGLVLPVLDYEFAGLDEIEPSYAPLRPPYALTLAPKLPGGLNLGKQIAWQRARFPDAFARARRYLTYPQYWAWRLCGIAASEVTMLGAHTELWEPLAGRYSSLAAALDLTRLTAPFRPAWESLGAVEADVAAATGLDPTTRVLNGVHDSNASLLPHLAFRRPPFTIVSTGTWVILMAVGLGVEALRDEDDMLANVDVEGRPTACARFMGGREYSAIVGEARGPLDADALARVVERGAMALPCFAAQGGPFARRRGEIRGDFSDADRPALATLYVALMTDLMLSRLGATAGDLIVEGGFVANPTFGPALAALRPRQRVLAGGDAAGAARGAALLAQWPPKSGVAPGQTAVAPAVIPGLDAYREAWSRAIEGD
ncbi:MAG: FGGY-family carbohydrate kinase [Roseiarcus sp.]